MSEAGAIASRHDAEDNQDTSNSVSHPYPGITNLGQTCYSAAAVQVLRKICELTGREIPLDIDSKNFENETNDPREILGNLLEAHGLEEHVQVNTY